MYTRVAMLAGPNMSPRAAVMVLACALALAACGSRNQSPTSGSASTEATAEQTGTTAPVAGTPVVPAPAVTQASWAPDALQHLVAPIALYPDQLVGQILAASVNSQEVLDAGNWLLENQSLNGDALDQAAQKAGFGPATRALVQFPQVMDMMCQQIDWTRQLGAAFTSDQKGVLDAVQQLRTQAAQVGNLKSTPQQTVETKTENQKTVIEVKPADPQVIYVPQYNPQVIYTTPPPLPTPAPASTEGTVSTGAAVAGGLVAFGVGMLIGSAIASNNCYPHWGAGAVYVGPRPFYPPAYVYRPVYSPGFRPAYGYASPPGYRYNYNNINRNVNVNINNNYFNQFNHNQNLRASNNLSGATRNPDWKGQSSYRGAHATPAQNARFTEATGRVPGATQSGRSPSAERNLSNERRQSPVGGAGSTRNPTLAKNRAPSPPLAQNRATAPDSGARRSASLDRGYADSNGAGGRSELGAARDSGTSHLGQSASSSLGPRDSGATRESAFSGGAGGFDRAASARGHASGGALLASHGGGGRVRR